MSSRSLTLFKSHHVTKLIVVLLIHIIAISAVPPLPARADSNDPGVKVDPETGCITYTTYQIPLDENGLPITDQAPVEGTDEICPSDIPVLSDANTVPVTLNCGYGQGAYVVFAMTRGTGRLGWYFKYWSYNGTQWTERQGSLPVVNITCKDDWCYHYSNRGPDSSRRYTLAYLSWSTAASHYSDDCY